MSLGAVASSDTCIATVCLSSARECWNEAGEKNSGTHGTSHGSSHHAVRLDGYSSLLLHGIHEAFVTLCILRLVALMCATMV